MADRAARRVSVPAATLRAEATKLWTLAGVRWLAAAIVAALVVVGPAVASTLGPESCRRDAACGVDPVRASLAGVWVAQIAAAVLGVVAMSTEYEPAQIRTTLAAMPRRLHVLAAKLVVVAGVAAAAGVVGTLGALAAGRAVVARSGFASAVGGAGVSLADAATVRAAVGTACYLALVAVLALGVATVLRDAALGVVSVLSLLFLFPIMAAVVSDPTWQHRIQRYAPMDAGLAVQATRGLDHLAIGPWAGLAVLAGYAAAGLAAGAVAFRYRDQ
jgi:ABC-2 type transport system permease protein